MIHTIKKKIKSALKSEQTQNFIALLLSYYLKFVYKTSSWQRVGYTEADHIFTNQSTIACFWHGRMAMIPFMWESSHKKVVALISAHSDGVIVAKTFKHLNIDNLPGSTNKGGATAFRGMMRALQRQDIIGIIPDGPRGPSQVLSEGIIQLAKHSKAPILPLSYATSRFIQLKSWDRFRIPLPFSKGVFIYGAPIYILDESDNESYNIESHRLEVENQLTVLQNKADELLDIKE